jgi:hypothetical protein
MEEEEIVQGAERIAALLRFVCIYGAVLLTTLGALRLLPPPLHPLSAAQWWGLVCLAVPVSIVIAGIAGRLGGGRR